LCEAVELRTRQLEASGVQLSIYFLVPIKPAEPSGAGALSGFAYVATSSRERAITISVKTSTPADTLPPPRSRYVLRWAAVLLDVRKNRRSRFVAMQCAVAAQLTTGRRTCRATPKQLCSDKAITTC